MSDLAENIHRAIYNKSGRINANPGNEHFEFGFSIGTKSSTDEGAPMEDLTLSWFLHGKPRVGTTRWTEFEEWKRGYWAARLQRVCAEAKEDTE